MTERKTANACYALQNRHSGQTVAPIERTVADARHTPRNRHALQAAAIGECVTADARHAAGNRYALQAAAIGERMITDCRYSHSDDLLRNVGIRYSCIAIKNLAGGFSEIEVAALHGISDFISRFRHIHAVPRCRRIAFPGRCRPALFALDIIERQTGNYNGFGIDTEIGIENEFFHAENVRSKRGSVAQEAGRLQTFAAFERIAVDARHTLRDRYAR